MKQILTVRQLSERDEKVIDTAINEAIHWLNANVTAKVDEYEFRRKKLEDKCNPIFAKMYKELEEVEHRHKELEKAEENKEEEEEELISGQEHYWKKQGMDSYGQMEEREADREVVEEEDSMDLLCGLDEKEKEEEEESKYFDIEFRFVHGTVLRLDSLRGDSTVGETKRKLCKKLSPSTVDPGDLRIVFNLEEWKDDQPLHFYATEPKMIVVAWVKREGQTTQAF